jgi:hypothetical protein
MLTQPDLMQHRWVTRVVWRTARLSTMSNGLFDVRKLVYRATKSIAYIDRLSLAMAAHGRLWSENVKDRKTHSSSKVELRFVEVLIHVPAKLSFSLPWQ